MKLMPEASSRPQGCVAATAIIWGCSTGMLAIDLLLANAQSEALISVAIVSAAAISTMTVWLSAQKTAIKTTEESEQPSKLAG